MIAHDIGVMDRSVSSIINNTNKEMTVRDVANVFTSILKKNVPIGKTIDNFTGGYIQQMSNSCQVVLYFGYKLNEEGKKTKNRDTVIIKVDETQMDMFYIGLKSKIIEMKFDKQNKNKIDFMDFVDIPQEEEEVSDVDIVSNPTLIEHNDDNLCQICMSKECEC